MAKEKEEKPEEIPWTPDKPLGDDDDEAEVQRRARANARLKHLESQYESAPPDKKDKKDGKKKSLWG